MNFTYYYLISGCLNLILNALYFNKIASSFNLKSIPTFVLVIIHFVFGFILLPAYIILFLIYIRLKILVEIRKYMIKKRIKKIKEIIDKKITIKE